MLDMPRPIAIRIDEVGIELHSANFSKRCFASSLGALWFVHRGMDTLLNLTN